MKLWLLRPKENRPKDDDPWEPWFDKSFGFVVRAENETKARSLAHDDAGDENRGEFLRKQTSKTKTPWLDPNYSICVELSSDGSEEVVLRDFAAA